MTDHLLRAARTAELILASIQPDHTHVVTVEGPVPKPSTPAAARQDETGDDDGDPFSDGLVRALCPPNNDRLKQTA